MFFQYNKSATLESNPFVTYISADFSGTETKLFVVFLFIIYVLFCKLVIAPFSSQDKKSPILPDPSPKNCILPFAK